MPGRRIKVNRPISPILTLKFIAIATSPERSENEGQVLDLQSNTYHMVKTGENRSSTVDPEIICLKGYF